MMEDVNFYLGIERAHVSQDVLNLYLEMERKVVWLSDTCSWDLAGDNPVRCCWSLGSLLFDGWRKAKEFAMTHGSIPTAASKLLCPATTSVFVMPSFSLMTCLGWNDPGMVKDHWPHVLWPCTQHGLTGWEVWEDQQTGTVALWQSSSDSLIWNVQKRLQYLMTCQVVWSVCMYLRVTSSLGRCGSFGKRHERNSRFLHLRYPPGQLDCPGRSSYMCVSLGWSVQANEFREGPACWA